MAGDLKDLQKLLNKAVKEIPEKAIRIVGVEAKKFVQQNFEDEGFNNVGVEKWEKRKTVDKKGRDITRYRTNKKGKKGTLNSYGRKNSGRAILTGHTTGGDKLRNSFTYRSDKSKMLVSIRTYKKYAKVHNEGLNGMPKRKFLGGSKYLANKISKKLDKTLAQQFNQ